MEHIPVLHSEVLSFFEDLVLSSFIDATTGAGGHSTSILKAHPEITEFFCFDQDQDALEIAKNILEPYLEKITFFHSNFEKLEELTPHQVDGILFDIGVSSMQLDKSEKGFSFMREGPLDMRMDQSQPLTAKDIVNTYKEKELADIFFHLGEERKSRRIARAIVERRKKTPFETTLDLATCIESVMGKPRFKHPATRTFQALRIYVNRELEVLEKGLNSAINLLRPNGRLAVITFHSLEDRIVKNLFRSHEKVNVLTKKPIPASFEETKINRRARSAKLRVVEKKEST